MELEESVEFSNSIKPACIANYNNIEIDTSAGSVVTSGWGIAVENCTHIYDPCMEGPNILQGTEMYLLSRSICNLHMTEETKMNPVTDDMICANDHSRVCSGDSGGTHSSELKRFALNEMF